MKYKEDPRHQARKRALSKIFSVLFETEIPDAHVTDSHTSDILDEVFEDKADFDQNLYEQLVEGVLNQRAELLTKIEQYAVEWPIDKISRIDLAILLIAVYELSESKDLSEKVVIDEAVELAKEFGNDTSKKFINGVLGAVAENLKND